MNKYNIRKTFLTLGLSGTMVLVAGCSNKEEKVVSNQRVEQELDFIEPTMDPVDTSAPIVTASPKKKWQIKSEKKETKKETEERLLKEIEKSEFDSLTKDILKDIAKESKNEMTQNQLSIACNESEKSLRDLWLYNTIMEATREQKIIRDDYSQYYKLEKLKIFNNLDGSKKGLPKDIEVMANISNYGDYKFYEVIANLEFRFLVTDKEDRVLLVANNDTVVKAENYKLQKFESVLKKYGITPEEIYCGEKLSDEVLPFLSIKMSEATMGNLQSIKTSDIVVLDSSKLADKEGYDNRYYFLKYRCPYLFDSEMPKIYTDIFNLDANAVISPCITFYKDYNKDHCMYDTCIPGNEISYFSLNSFLKSQGIQSSKKISYEELKDINNKVNEKVKKLKK